MIRALFALARFNPGLLAGLVAVVFSLGFGAGWKVKSWQADAAETVELREETKRLQVDLATLDEMADGAIALTRWLAGHAGRLAQAVNEEMAALSVDVPEEFEREKEESGNAVSVIEDDDACRRARPSRRVCEQRAARLGLDPEVCRAL